MHHFSPIRLYLYNGLLRKEQNAKICLTANLVTGAQRSVWGGAQRALFGTCVHGRVPVIASEAKQSVVYKFYPHATPGLLRHCVPRNDGHCTWTDEGAHCTQTAGFA